MSETIIQQLLWSLNNGKVSTSSEIIMPSVKLELLLSACLAILFIVAILVGVLDSSVILPSVTPITADPSEFSGARAREHLELIAIEPHPWYSKENERVFEYILSHGDSLVARFGTSVIETSIQNATQYNQVDYNAYTEESEIGSIINVAYLLKGKTTTGINGSAIQVSAHYDGVPMGPSATDDGAGCAIMLELASVLAFRSTNGDQLERDVLILFVDAEEYGLIGAKYWATGSDKSGNDISHPWSFLPSFAINMEGSGTATSGAMLVRSNSRFATDAYRKYAPYPKAISLTEWIYKTIQIGLTDSNYYWTQGIHLLDLIWVENRWAYHSADDNIENVRSASLQSCGDNILSIVSRVAASGAFPDRIPKQDLVESGVIQSDGGVGMESGTVYFSILGGTMIWMPFGFARVLYIVLAVFLGLTMPLLVGSRYSEEGSKCNYCSVDILRVSIRHALLALLNLLLGLVSSIASFAMFGMWKAPSEEEYNRRAGFWDGAIVAWGGIGAARSFLSLFTVCCTSVLLYMPLRADMCCFNRNNASNAIDNVRDNSHAPVDANELVGEQCCVDNTEDEKGGGNQVRKVEHYEKEEDIERQPSTNSIGTSDDDAKRLESIGYDSYLGVFYFFDTLLLLLGSILPDSACVVMWQPIFMWFASLVDVLIIKRLIRNNQEQIERNRITGRFGRWLTNAFLSAFPALLLLPAGMYILVNAFGYFMDDLGYWFGAPLVDSFCFGLIFPLFTPIWLPLPRKAFRFICLVCCLGWAASAISCMVI